MTIGKWMRTWRLRGGRRAQQADGFDGLRRKRRAVRELRFESLEDRRLLAVFSVTNTNDSGVGSLRQAILDSNTSAGVYDTIRFNLGTSAKSIVPLSALPTVTDPVTIDGASQPGFVDRPVVELNGSMAGSGANGLTITAGNTIVRGLAINRFNGNGIAISRNGGNRIEGNFIGTDLTGKLRRANAIDGVLVDGASSNTIGGTNTATRNVISGNTRFGITVIGSGATRNVLQGNFIGTDVTGTAAVGNGADGIFTQFATLTTIGGTSSGARNIISGNGRIGVFIQSGTSGNRVIGNYIGTDVTGTRALGNALDGVLLNGAANTLGGTEPNSGNVISANGRVGVYIQSSGNQIQGNRIGTDVTGAVDLGNTGDGVFIADQSNNSIGGTAPGSGNLISGNDRNGVEVAGNNSRGNLILSNSISLNGGLGIELKGDGPTLNDSGDIDTGPNGLQNFPVLTSAEIVDGKLKIQGSLSSTPNTAFRIEFFSSAALDATGYGEGGDFLQYATLTTDAAGNRSFTVTVNILVPVGRFITATVTDPQNNTSEFSRGIVVTDTTAPTADVIDVSPDPRTTSVSTISVRFSEPVSGVDRSDLTLTRDNGPNLLTAAQTLTTVDGGRTWVLGNLAGLTAAPGAYRLLLTAAGSGIRDAAGNLLQTNALDTWTCVGSQVSGAKWADRDGDGTWDADEPGLNGWTIELINAQGQRVASAVTRDLDLNGDGRIDPTSERGRYVFDGLAAGNYTVREVTQAGWLQRFPARFDLAAPVSYGAGTGPESVIATDFSSDGRLDLVVANAYGGSLSLLTNLGAGRFSNKTDIVLGGVISYVSAGDLNADGRIDLIATDQVTTNPGGGPASRLLILLNDGNGGFSVQPTIYLGSRANASAVADYNRDGKLDVAVGSLDSNFVSILLGNGDGTFRPRVDYGASSPRFLTTADVNRDGRTDLVVASVAGGVSVLRGRGDGTFEAAAYTSVGTRVVEVAAGDVNGDGWSDVVTANLDNNTVSLLLNDGTGKFSNFTNLPVGGSPHGVSLFDADHDGDLDVVSANQNGGSITVLTNNGSGVFARAADIATGPGPQGAAIGDLDGDGADDVAVAQSAGNNVAVLLSRATIHRVSLAAGQTANGLHFGNQLTVSAPGVSVSINGGATVTKSRTVNLALTPTGAPTEMRHAIDGQTEDRYSAWAPFAATKTLTLPNSQGSHSIYVQVRDAMGRIGLANGSIALDTVAPSSPVYQGMWTDTGRSGNDWITRDHTIAIYGRAEPWATIEVTLAGVGVLGTTPVYGSGDWQFDYMHVTLNDGQYQFTTRTIDRAGNASAPTSPLRVTIDGAAPSRPSITGISDDTGSPGDGVTSDSTLVLRGTAEAGGLVELTRVGTGVIGTALADASGTWSYDYTNTPLPAGVHEFTAKVTDVAGNVSAPSNAFRVTVQRPDDRYEENDSRSQAADLGAINGTLTVRDLVLADAADWYSFRLAGATSSGSQAELTFRHALGDIDMELYDSSGSRLRAARGFRDQEVLSLDGLPAGPYYLRVYGVGGVSNPNYTLELRHSVPATHSQAANIGTLSSAQTLNDLVLADDGDWLGLES
ncbi:MAG: FG-GAP-like repeat-containing protein [Pirellulaceae bacterium]|nr:FG-GAP-like repeat-containing protein [Pirellulaceae bacterium]